MNALGTVLPPTAESEKASYLPFGLFTQQQTTQPAVTTGQEDKPFFSQFQSRVTGENAQQQYPFISQGRDDSPTISNIISQSPAFLRAEKVKPKLQFPFDTLSQLSPEVILIIAALLAWFFFPTGIVAVVFAVLAQSEHKKGTNKDLAAAYTTAAQKWIVVTMLIVTVMVFVALLVVLVMQILNFASHKSNSNDHQPSH